MLIMLAYLFLWIALLIYIVQARLVKPLAGRLASGSLLISWGLLSAGLILRGLEAGHWPLTNRYEFALCFSWAISGIYLLLESSWGERRAGPFVAAIALLVMTYAITRPPGDKEIYPLLPALRSIWLQVHVLSASLGYGAAGVAAGLGLARLMPAGEPDEDEQRRWLPPRSQIEHTMERTIALGFPWLTLGLLAGAIWAQNAWGSYWNWDPKETWALVTWLWYLLILHVRSLRNWRGRRLAVLAIFGFGMVIFTFIGVPWLVRTVRLESLHGF
jgi:cytochrome c-type biogenesis protein CcsB